MKFKDGVKIAGIRNEMVLALMAVQEVAEELDVRLVVTSALDGSHSYASLHYSGSAVDIRTRDISTNWVEVYAARIRDALTDEFDVVVEPTHIHIEFQPKRS